VVFGAIIATIIYVALLLFIGLMWARLFFDLGASLARSWRPKGPLLVLAEFAFLVTDPPVKLVRRVVHPLRIGSISLDLSWTIVVLVALILSWIVFGFVE
jgi:YggT family protein